MNTIVLYKFSLGIGKDKYQVIARNLTSAKEITHGFFCVPDDAIKLLSQRVYKKIKY